MPEFNGTGPMGAGPMTGGGRGLCSPAYAGRSGAGMGVSGFGRGMAFRRGARAGYGPGRGAGGGFGRGPAYSQAGYAASSSDETSVLKQQAQAMQNSLDAIVARIVELEKTKGE